MKRELRGIANEYVMQDNRATAYPYALIVIQKEKNYHDDGDYLEIVFEDEVFDIVNEKDYASLLDSVLDEYWYDPEHSGQFDSLEEYETKVKEIKDYWNEHVKSPSDCETFCHVYSSAQPGFFWFDLEYNYDGLPTVYFLESSACLAADAIRKNNPNGEATTYGIRLDTPEYVTIIKHLLTVADVPIEAWNHEALHYYNAYVLKPRIQEVIRQQEVLRIKEKQRVEALLHASKN